MARANGSAVGRFRATRRQLTLIIAAVGVGLSFAVASYLPVPYVILSPGPTLNALGTGPGGRSLVQISGHRTYPGTGHLNLVTVSFQGGPSDRFNIFTALQAWLTTDEAVVPEQELFGPGQTQQQVTRQDTQEMASSEQTATAAALCLLGMKFTVVDKVVTVEKGMPAAGVLRAGDVITAVDGVPVTCKADARAMIRSHSPGTPVTLSVERNGTTRQVRLTTVTLGGHAVVGVAVAQGYRGFPFGVRIRVGNIGGPSAGLMFALAIVDKLTPGSLTGGRFVAGTGEISADGTVSPIGGVQQKMVGARAAGATIFLTPAANCADIAGAIPSGLRLVKVSTLSGAVRALNSLVAGKDVPSC
jgi:PDZ domain-containing protein